ncbi:MAG TPA: M13 family metallopeptidase, partial [Polyangiaceae bacterium]
LASRKDSPPGSSEQLAGDFYASCIDDTAADRAGLTPLAPLLGEIDTARTHADVARVIRRLHEVAVSVPFGVTGAYENSEPTVFAANVVAGPLGMGDRDAYLKPEPRFAKIRDDYRAHVMRMLKLAGMPEARTREAADGVLALEKRFAEASLDAKTAADAAATEHKTTFAQLKELAPRVDWEKYFDEAKLPPAAVNVAEPKLLQQVDAELQNTPVPVWKAYLEFHLLESASPFLSKAFADESLGFKDRLTGGASSKQPRTERCAEITEALLGEPVGREYAERYFPPAAKAKVQEIARNLVSTLKDAVSSAAWMGAETKGKALEKVAGLRLQFGYPDQWKDYGAVTIRRDQLWANVAQARRFLVEDTRKAIGKPTDRSAWAFPPSSPDAYLDPQLNELVLPAGFLQPPAFDPAASDAVNYGAIGAGLMHDLTHSVDATGAELDAQGRAHGWWTEDDRRAFEKRASCVVDQYDAYTIEPGVHLQGKLVRNEAIGDLAGLHLAFAALEKSMETKPVPVLGGFTPQQQFFLSWGQYRGEAMRLDAQRDRVKEDPHPTPQFRVIGPVSSLPEFQQAFACKAGDPMVRSPSMRCSVW